MLFILIFAIFNSVPKIIWGLLGILAAIILPFYLYKKFTRSKSALNTEKKTTEIRTKSTRHAEDNNPIRLSYSSFSDHHDSDFQIPAPPKEFSDATWIQSGQSVKIAGLTICGGMVYVGTSLKTPYGNNDPCLIDPSKPVSSLGNFVETEIGYWPNYSEITATARRSYLNWLENGRCDPNANIGFVFLFFYGLERRAILDATSSDAAKADLPDIAEEIRRLISIYGNDSGSFLHYANALLNWISLIAITEKLYEKPLPSFSRTFELPMYIRVALGQAAMDSVPIPAALALAWSKLEPSIPLRTPVIRCNEQFEKLFLLKYSELFGSGLLLPRNRTKLKFVYRPASSGFNGFKEIKLNFGNTPDITALTAPQKKLQQIVEAATKELESYSRFIGKNPDAENSLEGMLLLPTILWNGTAQTKLEALESRVNAGFIVMPFEELLSQFGADSALSRDKMLRLVRVLAEKKIGLEPDILSGAKLPKLTDDIVLFRMSSEEIDSQTAPAYQAALLTLQLASSVASADGQFSSSEIDHLSNEVKSWSNLTSNHSTRLLAHLNLLVKTPVSLHSLKKKLEPLDTQTRESIAVFMATVAQSDGTVSPEEVKILEKVYKVLGVDANKVFSDIHAVASGTKPNSEITSNIEKTGFKLDASRITALQQDTDKVSILLANIFKEEDIVIEQLPDTAFEPEQDSVSEGVLGLDATHSAFARMLLSRPQWSREELIDLATDLDLMLDGALEQINEASYDTYDIPLTEGDDPVEVNIEIMEKIET